MSRLHKVTTIADHFSFKTLLIIIVFLLIPLVTLARISQRKNISQVAAAWFNEAWSYRQRIDTTNSGVGQTNVFVTLTIGTSDLSRFQSDCGDIRFTDQNNNLLPYYIASGCGTAATVLHINFPTLPPGSQTFYIYYGNSSATNGFSSSDFSTAAATTALTPASEESSPAPYAYWKFDEGVGATAFDSSANKLNASFAPGSSAPAWVTSDQCMSGSCLKFDGAQYLSPGSASKFGANDTSGTYTVETWIRPTDVSGWKIIAQSMAGSAYWGINYSSFPRLITMLHNYNTAANAWPLGSKTVSLNKWNHVALVFSHRSGLKYYVNGQLDADIPNVDYGFYPYYANTNIGYYIGDTTTGFKGYMDDFKVFKYARTSSQIASDYASGLSGQSSTSGNSANLGSSSSGKSLTDGLVGYWKMDENTGTTATDNSGNNITATFSTGDSAPSWSNGKYGSGILFDNINDRISTGTTLAATAGSARTLSAWVKDIPTTGRHEILNTFNNYFNIQSNLACIYITGANSTYVCSGSTLPPTQWNHVVVTYENNREAIYINGNLSAGATTTTSAASSGPVDMGICTYCGMTGPLGGSLDEVRIYNRALSASEVTALYNYAPGPTVYIPADEGSDTPQDKSGNSYLTSWSGTGPRFNNGKFNKAASFNGVDDGLYVNSNTFSSRQGTAEFWINPQNNPGGADTRLLHNFVTNRFYITLNSNYTLSLRTGDANTLVNFATTPIAVNNWTHVAVAWDSQSTKAALFLNGQSVGTTAYVDTSNTLGPVYFANQGATKFKGLLDDIRLYNYVRTTAQILADMNASSAISSKTPLVNYKFDEGQGNSINNSGIAGIGSSGIFGTGSSSPAWSSDGKSGKSVFFDGSLLDYIQAPAIPSITTGTPFTISVWVKPQTNTSYNTILGYDGTHRLLMQNGGKLLSQQDGDFYSTKSIPMNTWTHVIYWNNGSQERWYLNGVLDNTHATPNAEWNGAYKIGQYDNQNYPFKGNIDELKIYNYALSEAEIKSDYNLSSTTVVGSSTQSIGATTTSLDYCLPGDPTPCAPPVAEWNFNENIGTSTVDTSGNNNTAIFGPGSSAPTWTLGKTNSALSFNGNAYLAGGTAPSLDLTSGATVEAWVKPSEFNTDTDHSTIVTKNSSYYFQINNLGKLQVYQYGVTPAGYHSSNTALVLNKWQHVAYTYDGANIRIFINGIGDTTIPATGNINTSTYCLGIGANLTTNCLLPPTYMRRFKGSIDQVKIYNYARTPAQVAYDYNKGTPVGYWKFDECQGNIVNDSSGIGNTGSITVGAAGTQTSLGTCQVGTSAAWTAGASGKVNSSLNLDGTDDYVQVAHSSALMPASITVSGWLKPNSSAPWMLVDKAAGGTSGSYYIYSDNLANSSWTIFGPTGTRYDCMMGPLSIGTWYFLTGTYDATTGKMKCYANGILKNTVDSAALGSNTSPLYFGHYSSGGYYTNGKIDDIRIYNYALTATQIKSLYNGGAINFAN